MPMLLARTSALRSQWWLTVWCVWLGWAVLQILFDNPDEEEAEVSVLSSIRFVGYV